MIKKSQAMAWWDTIRNTNLMNGTKDKGYYSSKYFGWNMRMYKFFTEKEIEEIWEKEEKPQVN